jgi:hypothetical protein
LSAAVHALHAEAHALSQHTLSVQKAVAHSLAAPHAAPLTFFGAHVFADVQ